MPAFPFPRSATAATATAVALLAAPSWSVSWGASWAAEPSALLSLAASAPVGAEPVMRPATRLHPHARCAEWGAVRPYVAPQSEWRRCRARKRGAGE